MTTPLTDPDEAFAVFRRSGDADALGVVYDAFAPGLLRLALKLLGDATAAEDVLQATFVTAIESAARHDGERPVGPWFAGILANEVRAHRRRSARTVDPERLAPRAAPSDPAQDAIDAELDGAVGRHVRELPDAWQQPVLLRVRQGLTVPEIAAALGRPAGTIRGQIARGLARLRAGLVSALGAFGLARLTHRTEWKKGGRPSVAAKSVVSLGAVVMGVSLVSLTVWGVAAVLTGGAAEDESVAATVPVVNVVEESTGVAPPLAVDALSPVPLALVPAVAVATRDENRGNLPARIVVVDGAGVPTAGASIDVYANAAAYDAYEAALHTHTTDGAGVWKGTIEGGQAVVARSGRWRTGLIRTFGSMTEFDRVLGMSRIATVRGRVVDAAGEPVAGVDVLVGSVGSGGLSIQGSTRRPPSVTSGDDGRFVVDLDPGMYGFSVRLAKRACPSVRVATEDVPSEVTVRIPGDWHVRGTVVDANGDPVAGKVSLFPDAELTVDEAIGTGSHPHKHSTKAGADGAFDLMMPRLGKYRVVASAEGHAPSALVDVALSSESPVAQVDLVLHEAVSISGRVVDDDGQPIGDVVVSTKSISKPEGLLGNIVAPRESDLIGLAFARTNESGDFVLEGLSPIGVYDITVKAGSGVGAASFVTCDIAGGASGLLLVEKGELRTTSIGGRVVEAATGEPVRYYTLHVARDYGDFQSVTKHDIDDPDGRFFVDGIGVDWRYAISIVPVKAERIVGPLGHDFPSERRDLAAIDVPFQKLDPAGETFEFRLFKTGSVDVTLLDATGAPRAYTHVQLGQTERVRLGVSVTRRGRTDERGRITFPSVPPRTYEAIVDGVVYEDVEVPAGETITVVLTPEEDN